MSASSDFLSTFRNSIITKTSTVDMFPDNLSTPDIFIIEQQLTNLASSINSLLDLTVNGAIDQRESYDNIVKTLNNKVDYIDNVSEMLMYINSYYDMNNVMDVFNIDVLSPSINSSLIFNSKEKGITLKNVSSSYNCPKSIQDSKITFYNTNLAYHSGINISSPFLNIIDIASITIRKNNGETVQLNLNDFNIGDNYIKHDLLSSTQIDVQFTSSLYLDSIQLSLIDYKYIPDGSILLEPKSYNVGSLFNFIYSASSPSDCFINNNTTVELLDINNNTIDTISVLLPVGKTLVCKSVYDVDFSLVGDVVGIYYNNVFSNRSDLTESYLSSITNKKETYIVFYPKMRESDIKTNNIRLVNNQGFIINNKNTKTIRVSTSIEFHSFNVSLSPTLKAITGVTKI